MSTNFCRHFNLFLFTTTLLIFTSRSTWSFVLEILGAFESTWLVNSALGCTCEHSEAPDKPSRTYLKNNEF